MTSNRTQKLLFSEYSDFEDIVLVEGPFAETDRQGRGIRQVQLGLTPTKLILASYFVEPVVVEELDHWRPRRGQDPDIESFELVSAYPVESVNLSVYRHRRRQTLKARFCNGKVVYYEIGGWQERKMLWSVWCERIKFLSPYESGISVSETSVGSSTSGSSALYIVRSSLSVNQVGKPTLWCHYACTEGSWADPHLYLGPKFYDKGYNSSSILDVGVNRTSIPRSKPKSSTKKQRRRQQKERLILTTELEVVAAEAVALWEGRRASPKIRRRYALHPCPYLLGGLGPWRVSKPQAHSLQTKRNVSTVDLRCEWEGEEVLPLPRGRLLRTVSLESLTAPGPQRERLKNQQPQQKREEVVFWTRCPEDLLQWGPSQYRAQQQHLKETRKRTDPHIFGIREKKKFSRKQNRSKTGQNVAIRPRRTSESVDAHGAGGDTFPARHIYSSLKDGGEEGWLLPISRFTSSNLAHQLTMIHKQLFLQIATLELARARGDRCSWRAPALRSLVAFSHRVSCLAANHVLLEHEVQKRARVIGKLMSVAHKCHRMHNMLSTEAVLRGLHSPPIYRLHRTWAFVRRHYATNYRRFEDLSRRYLDCREPLYQRTYDDVIKVPPFLPAVSLLVAVLLQTLPEVPPVPSFKFTSGRCVPASSNVSAVSVQGSVSKLLSSLQLAPSPSPAIQPSSCQSRAHLHAASRETLLEQLDAFFAPVSGSQTQRALQDTQYFLESHQAAAARYHIPINPTVRAFLLHSRHPDMPALHRQSLLIEP